MILNEDIAVSLLAQIRAGKLEPLRERLKPLKETEQEEIVTLLLINGIDDYQTSLIPFLLDEQTGLIKSDDEKNNLIEDAMFRAMMVDNDTAMLYLFTLLGPSKKTLYANALFMPATIQRNLGVIPVLYDCLSTDTQLIVLSEALDAEDVDVLKIIFPLQPLPIKKQIIKEFESKLKKGGDFYDLLRQFKNELLSTQGPPFWSTQTEKETQPGGIDHIRPARLSTYSSSS